MNEPWEETKEEDGLTLGPEEALEREIEKSKTLKVDRLRLRDEIEKLKIEKSDLAQKNQQLKERLTKLSNTDTNREITSSSSSKAIFFSLVLVVLALIWLASRN
jgi:hypothetical protein